MMTPGSPFPGLDMPFAWYAIVKDRAGKQWTYWINGTHPTREALAEHCRQYFRGVEVLTVERCTSMPSRALQPIPPEHFEFGIRREIEAAADPVDPVIAATGLRPLNIKPISLKPLTRR